MCKKIAIVMSGGSGNRLWPLSARGNPKQFHCFGKSESLLYACIKRMLCKKNASSNLIDELYVVGNIRDREKIQSELKKLPDVSRNIVKSIYEPFSRNTAAALSVGAEYAINVDPEAVLIVTPADHAIMEDMAYMEMVECAINSLADHDVILLGISPTRPDINYGYIKYKEGDSPVREVCRFYEKPELSAAIDFIADGKYLWNSGVFILKAKTWKKMLEKTHPIYNKLSERINRSVVFDGHQVSIPGELFNEYPNISIDKCVMEDSNKIGISIGVVRFNIDWHDLGTWKSVWNYSEKNSDGNVVAGRFNISNVKNSVLIQEDSTVRLNVCDMSNVAVVAVGDNVMISSLDSSNGVKNLAEMNSCVQDKNLLDKTVNKLSERPWGDFRVVMEDTGFKIKVLTIKEGHSISLQYHNVRAEHWVVVDGKAEVQNENETHVLEKNESTYIKPMSVHRLKNIGTSLLKVVEVQTGEYLGEDDIVRIVDQYGRA